MTRPAVALLLSVGFVTPAVAGQAPDDFAYGFTVTVDGTNPLWQLDLPDEVYTSVTRADLGDLRVFDRNGLMVPHVVRRPAVLLADRPAPRQLTVFPVRGRAAGDTRGQTLRIVTNAQGEAVAVVAEDLAAGDSDRVIAYLVQVGGLALMPERLELAWTTESDRGFVATVDVQASDDLSRWSTIVSGATLADLASDNEEMVHRELDLPGFDARYLRIDWPVALSDVELTGLRAFFPARERRAIRRTIRIPGVPAGDSPQAYEFDTGGMRPVDQMRVVLSERNAVLQASLLSRTSADEAWRRRRVGTFYNLERDGTPVRSAAARLDVVSDRYWRLEVGSGPRWAGAPPVLEVGWVPDVLTAVGQGEAPFTVAFGSATVQLAAGAPTGLFDTIEDESGRSLVATVSASEVVPLGGESRLIPPDPPFPWTTWLLWAVLVGGVGLLTWMVRQLVTNMRTS